ncbi:TPA: hypothetical protein N2723_000071 [Vibrio parahaemolyticus]|nr:hypothetical protein [Vibrio parahaemolyticus]
MDNKEPNLLFLVIGSAFALTGFGYLVGINSNQESINFTNALVAALGSLSSFFALLLALTIYFSWKASKRKEILHSKLFDVFNQVDELSFAMSYYIMYHCNSSRYTETMNELFKLKRQCNILEILHNERKTPKEYGEVIKYTKALIEMSELLLFNETAFFDERHVYLTIHNEHHVTDNVEKLLEAQFQKAGKSGYTFNIDKVSGEFRAYTNDAIQDWAKFI